MELTARKYVIAAAVVLVVLFFTGYAATKNSGCFFGVKTCAKLNQLFGRKVASSDYEQCKNSSDTFDCYKTALLKRLDENGAADALLAQKALYDGHFITGENCHLLGHELGREAVRKYRDAEVALSYETGVCFDGYAHGVLYELFGDESVAHGFTFKKGLKLCENREQEWQSMCFHGLGHGLMIANKNDLAYSLKTCDTISEPKNKISCHDGAFHNPLIPEFLKDIQEQKPAFIKIGDPFYTCDKVDEQYKKVCYWRYGPVVAVSKPGDSTTNIINTAKDVPDRYKNSYWYGIGTWFSFEPVGKEEDLINICSSFPKEGKLGCIGGAVITTASIVHRIQGQDDFDRFCSMIPDEETRASCLKNKELMEDYPASIK